MTSTLKINNRNVNGLWDTRDGLNIMGACPRSIECRPADEHFNLGNSSNGIEKDVVGVSITPKHLI